jgi:hypothetical protein
MLTPAHPSSVERKRPLARAAYGPAPVASIAAAAIRGGRRLSALRGKRTMLTVSGNARSLKPFVRASCRATRPRFYARRLTMVWSDFLLILFAQLVIFVFDAIRASLGI